MKKCIASFWLVYLLLNYSIYAQTDNLSTPLTHIVPGKVQFHAEHNQSFNINNYVKKNSAPLIVQVGINVGKVDLTGFTPFNALILPDESFIDRFSMLEGFNVPHESFVRSRWHTVELHDTAANILRIYDENGNEIKEAAIENPFFLVSSINPNKDIGYNNVAGETDIAFASTNTGIGIISESAVELTFNITNIGIGDNPVARDITFVDMLPLLPPGNIKKEDFNSLTTSFTGGYLFFRANDGINGIELWISDGTPSGTNMVKNINPNPFSFISDIMPMNSMVYFSASNDTLGGELWKSDGTEAGTVMVKDINPFGSSFIDNMINIGGMLYFRATNGTDGVELWKSDGTSAGTVMIKDINQTSPGASSFPSGFTLFNGLIYFAANDFINGAELWVTDGTFGGTKMVKNINNTGDGSASSFPILPGLPNGSVFYFYADDGVHGKELWISDGTNEGTQLGYDIFPGPSNSNNHDGWGKIAGGDLYVSADNGAVGHELLIFQNAPTNAPMTSCSLKVFLEGPYNSGSMSTNLTVNIPLRQPFNNEEFGHYGDETIDNTFAATNNIVDWALVELRSGASASVATTVVAKKAVLLKSDGTLVDLDGSADIDFKWIEAGDYYVSVYHRNHLAVLSSGTVTLTN